VRVSSVGIPISNINRIIAAATYKKNIIFESTVMDKRDMDNMTNASNRKQPLKTTVSMPILGQSSTNNDEIRRDRRQPIINTDEMSALPDSGDDDDQPRTPLTKSTSCYVQQTDGQLMTNKLSRADDQ